MNEQVPSKGEQRRHRILNLLKAQGRVTIQEIIEKLNCSEATARRDLDMLSKTEGVIRTIGGAQFEGYIGAREETSFQDKKQLLWIEKERIAAKAASLVREGDIIGLTGGTTTYLIAKALKSMKYITVVTNAVNIAMELADQEDIQVVLTGGIIRSKSYELSGPLAAKTVADLNIGKMFVGIDGLTVEQGVTTYSELEAEIAKLMISRTKQTIAVFDHTKSNKASLFSVAPLSSLHACITDEPLDAELEQYFTKQGVQVYYAE